MRLHRPCMQFKHVQTTPFRQGEPSSTLTKLPNLNSSQRKYSLKYATANLAISVWYSICSELFGSSRYLIVTSSFPGTYNCTTGPAYESQTQAEERARYSTACATSHRRPPAAGFTSSTEWILSGPGATLNAMSGSTQWVCGSTLFMLACRVILQVHNPQATTHGPPSSDIRPGAVL